MKLKAEYRHRLGWADKEWSDAKPFTIVQFVFGYSRDLEEDCLLAIGFDASGEIVQAPALLCSVLESSEATQA